MKLQALLHRLQRALSTLIPMAFDNAYNDKFPYTICTILTHLMTWMTMDSKQDHFEMLVLMTVDAWYKVTVH